MRDLLTFLDRVPEHYKTGNWAYEAHLGIMVVAVWIAFSYKGAMDSYGQLSIYEDIKDVVILSGLHLPYIYFGIGLYFFIFMAISLSVTGPWPLVSYTVSSWNVLTIRLLSLGLRDWHPAFASLARILKFPALLMNTVTVTIWWMVLVPVISYLLPGEKAKNNFKKFNLSPFLLHIHGINLPVAIFEFLGTGTRLTFFDLWAGVVGSFLYMLFYLNVLDPAGIQIYIPFTPRTRWSILLYLSIFSMHYMLWAGGNATLSWLSEGRVG